MLHRKYISSARRKATERVSREKEKKAFFKSNDDKDVIIFQI